MPADYRHVARELGNGVDVVSVQHEYGIWGGDDGESVLDFVQALPVPAVSTLHTVLRAPPPGSARSSLELVRASAATVVMSRVGGGAAQTAGTAWIPSAST